MVRIYISSTYEDLKEYREAVYRALRKLDPSITVMAMEDYVATDQRPLQKCLEDVASCDIYIGIFAWRYGFIPEYEKDNPGKLSITELEYRKAKEKDIPCLIFLLDDNAAWTLSFIDGTPQSGTNGVNINRLRNELKNEYIASFFKNPDNLASQVVPAVNKKMQELNSRNEVQIITENKKSIPTSLLVQKPLLFKGEKSFFVGREEYINKIIKEKIQVPSLKVCIVGPGGSGKTQLAFKAIHQYEKEGLFDLVIPVYFSDVSTMTFSTFLLNIAKSFLDVNQIGEFEKLEIEQRKTIIYNYLDQKKHPLLFLDNYETVSYIINDQRQTTTEQYDNVVNISNYLNNEIPDNISVLITSRERNNNFGDKEKRIDLEGLHEQESLYLFSSLTSDDYLKNKENIQNNPTTKAVIDKIFERTGGHPLSIEIIAKNTSSIYQINQMANTLGIEKINPNEPEKRLRSLEASFNYTVSIFSDNIKNLLYYLTVFKSPFPIDVAEKVFYEDNNFITELYDRSLLLKIKSETSFGEIKDPDYWLYIIHPAIRNYLEKTVQKTIGKTIKDLEEEYAHNFYKYYHNMLWDTDNSIGKDGHRSSIARFNLIYNQGSENNDFDRAIEFAKYNDDLWYCANISRALGNILWTFGLYSKSLEYHNKALGFDKHVDFKAEMAGDYANIGNAYYGMGKYEQALQYHNKALEIDTELNDRVGLASDYKNIGVVYYSMGKYEQALDYYNKALEINTEINDRAELAGDYANIGNVYRNLGKYEQALDYYNKALEINTELNDRVGLVKDYKNIGNAYYGMGKYEQALQYHNKALEIDTELNDRVGLASDYKNIGVVYDDVGKYEQALQYHNKALEIHLELNDRVALVKDYYNMSFPLYNMNQKKDALQHLYTAKTILLDLQKETGYSHPLLKKVQDRLSYLKYYKE